MFTGFFLYSVEPGEGIHFFINGGDNVPNNMNFDNLYIDKIQPPVPLYPSTVIERSLVNMDICKTHLPARHV